MIHAECAVMLCQKCKQIYVRVSPQGASDGRWLCKFNVLAELVGLGATNQQIDPDTDPLDVEYDDVPLRALLRYDEQAQRERGNWQAAAAVCSHPVRRAAIDAYRAAELRLKVAAGEAASAARETKVYVEVDEP
jgi:hypothetical protein